MSVVTNIVTSIVTKKTVVFLGGGRITAAMLAGLRLAQHDYRLVVHDRNAKKLRQLKKVYAVAIENDLEPAIAEADILVIAVRPHSIRELFRSVDRSITKKARGPIPLSGALAVSLAAGVPLRVLSELPLPFKWARAMPSPVCRFAKGLTAVTFSRSLSREHREQIKHLFALVGAVVEIPESRFDAFTVAYSSSHGYHALTALAASAQAAGLDRKTALLASAHALADGILAWREGTVSLDELLAEAATPGGIAAETMAAMEASGYQRAVRRGIDAGMRRARSNAGK